MVNGHENKNGKKEPKSKSVDRTQKTHVQYLAILVEAVSVLNDSKKLKKDLAERSAILKSKFLNDKETRIKIEDELTKILL